MAMEITRVRGRIFTISRSIFNSLLVDFVFTWNPNFKLAQTAVEITRLRSNLQNFRLNFQFSVLFWFVLRHDFHSNNGLVANFHSPVNVKLDSTNYLLWQVQVENVMQANGFYEYLEGTVEYPPSQISSAEGTLSSNPAFVLWKLIDTQLLSCLTASLALCTLPYVLGLHHAHEVWDSLSNCYNSLSKSNVQELKSKLYSITKTSTIEKYVDTIKEYAQKLVAAGNPVDDDDLIFQSSRSS